MLWLFLLGFLRGGQHDSGPSVRKWSRRSISAPENFDDRPTTHLAFVQSQARANQSAGRSRSAASDLLPDKLRTHSTRISFRFFFWGSVRPWSGHGPWPLVRMSNTDEAATVGGVEKYAPRGDPTQKRPRHISRRFAHFLLALAGRRDESTGFPSWRPAFSQYAHRATRRRLFHEAPRCKFAGGARGKKKGKERKKLFRKRLAKLLVARGSEATQNPRLTLTRN